MRGVREGLSLRPVVYVTQNQMARLLKGVPSVID